MLKLRQDGTIPRGDYIANEIHAHQLASRIRAYWRGRGHANVTVWAEPVKAGEGEAIGVRLHGVKDKVFWQVRSNLVNGLPLKENPLPPIVYNQESLNARNEWRNKSNEGH